MTTRYGNFWQIILVKVNKTPQCALRYFENKAVDNVEPVALLEQFRALQQTPMEHFRALKCSFGGSIGTILEF